MATGGSGGPHLRTTCSQLNIRKPRSMTPNALKHRPLERQAYHLQPLQAEKARGSNRWIEICLNMHLQSLTRTEDPMASWNYSSMVNPVNPSPSTINTIPKSLPDSPEAHPSAPPPAGFRAGAGAVGPGRWVTPLLLGAGVQLLGFRFRPPASNLRHYTRAPFRQRQGLQGLRKHESTLGHPA